jgi:hypothetical protein
MHRIYLAFGLGSLLITCLADPLGGQVVQVDSPARSRPAPGSATRPQKVHLKLRSGDAPAAARVSIVGGDEKPYGPAGAAIRRTKRDEPYCYADGAFDVELPPGRARMSVSGGIETIPQAVSLEAGTAVELSVSTLRWIDMAARGW